MRIFTGKKHSEFKQKTAKLELHELDQTRRSFIPAAA